MKKAKKKRIFKVKSEIFFMNDSWWVRTYFYIILINSNRFLYFIRYLKKTFTYKKIQSFEMNISILDVAIFGILTAIVFYYR